MWQKKEGIEHTVRHEDTNPSSHVLPVRMSHTVNWCIGGRVVETEEGEDTETTAVGMGLVLSPGSAFLYRS